MLILYYKAIFFFKFIIQIINSSFLKSKEQTDFRPYILFEGINVVHLLLVLIDHFNKEFFFFFVKFVH